MELAPQFNFYFRLTVDRDKGKLYALGEWEKAAVYIKKEIRYFKQECQITC